MTKVTMVQPHLSFSAINQFASCPRSWFSQRVLDKKQKAGDAASFGLAFEAQVLTALGATDEKALRDAAEGKASENRLPAEDQVQTWREIRAAADLYLRSTGALSRSTPGSLIAQRQILITPEQWGTLADCYGAAGEIHLPLIGYIDVLHTDPSGLRRTIYDLKTTTRAGCQPGWVLQTALYALAERAQKCELHVLVRPADRPTKKPRADDWLPNFQTALYQFRPTDETYRWVMTWCGSYVGQMRAAEQQGSLERFPATPGFFCSWCPCSEDCEANMLSNLAAFGGTKAGVDE